MCKSPEFNWSTVDEILAHSLLCIVIVGNGTSILDKANGDKIDNFDTVLRFNGFKIKGFEKNTGTKTNIWFTVNHAHMNQIDAFDEVIVHSWQWDSKKCKICGDDILRGYDAHIHNSVSESPRMKIDLLGKILKLNRKSIKWIKKSDSIAVVGNSDILLQNEYGELIDSHDYVIRCNLAKTDEKFLKHSGNKTNFRIITGKSFWKDLSKAGKHSGNKVYPGYDNDFITNLNGEHLLIAKGARPLHQVMVEGAIKNLKTKSYIHYLNEGALEKTDMISKLFKESYGSHNNHHPTNHQKSYSTGFSAIAIASSLSNNVSIFGFDWYKRFKMRGQNNSAHYFEKIHHGESGHNFAIEETIVKKMIEDEKIKIYN